MADIIHRGITWRDFPGNCDHFAKKLAFAEFRRGNHALNPYCEGLEGEALKLKLQELSQSKRLKWIRCGVRPGKLNPVTA